MTGWWADSTMRASSRRGSSTRSRSTARPSNSSQVTSSHVGVTSGGFRSFREYLAAYAGSDRFTTLAAEARRIKEALAEVEYCLCIRSGSVRVSRYESEPDYGAVVESIFTKFRQGTAQKDRSEATDSADMNHVEAQILDQLARLFPQVFQDLTDFCTRNRAWLDETVARFDREVQFYLAYGEAVERLTRAGLPFCIPDVGSSKEVRATDTFDIALALSLVRENQPVVCNEFHLDEPERIVVVSGPNQGGKTTFARTFGQLHVLARLGCPVPGTTARLFLFDELHTHFERAEDITDLRSKLENDLVRIHDILQPGDPAQHRHPQRGVHVDLAARRGVPRHRRCSNGSCDLGPAVRVRHVRRRTGAHERPPW